MRRRPRRGFSIVELLVALFVLALAMLIAAQVLGDRDRGWGRTAALREAPSAITALRTYLDARGAEAVSQQLATSPALDVYVVQALERGQLDWHVGDLPTIAALSGPQGPLYVARLKMAGSHGEAADLRVRLSWTMPRYNGEDEAVFTARVADAAPIAVYPLMILGR